jgi:hypothetical protein
MPDFSNAKAERSIRIDLRNAAFNAAACIVFLGLAIKTTPTNINDASFIDLIVKDYGLLFLSALNAGVCLYVFGRAITTQIKRLGKAEENHAKV